MNRNVYIILAFNHYEYRDKVSELRKEQEQQIACVYGNSEDRMRGINADKVVTCEGFWRRDDAVRLAKTAQSRLK